MLIDNVEQLDLKPEYEWLRERIVVLPSAPGPEARTLVWAAAGDAVGVSRDDDGRLEVFIIGPPLKAVNPVVRDALSHDRWTTTGGDTIEAARLLLPPAPHFDQIAAFICAELLNNGVADHREAGFARTEPIIALALTRARMGNEFLVGLAGELLVLRALLAQAPHASSRILESWKGSARTSRDFQLGSVGIEVKSTTGRASTHHVQGLHQIGLGVPVDDVPESSLYLMSIGLTWLDPGVTYGQSLESLVTSIDAVLADDVERSAFANALAAYGDGGSALGSPTRVSESAHYSRHFATSFERLYDMTDPAVSLPDSARLNEFGHLVVDSVAFRIALPDQVDGDLNPTVGLPEAARRVLVDAQILSRD